MTPESASYRGDDKLLFAIILVELSCVVENKDATEPFIELALKKGVEIREVVGIRRRSQSPRPSASRAGRGDAWGATRTRRQ
jgi:hypothetical protein